jgi:hypothetical protein
VGGVLFEIDGGAVLTTVACVRYRLIRRRYLKMRTVRLICGWCFGHRLVWL